MRKFVNVSRIRKGTLIKKLKGPKMYTPQFAMQQCKWEFTIGDDDHPSVPHAHALEYGYRLDAWSGKIYPKGNERVAYIGKLKKKELDALHKDPKFISFAKKQIEYYRSEHPEIKFYIPDWFENKYLRIKSLTVCQKKEIVPNTLYFIGTVIFGR